MVRDVQTGAVSEASAITLQQLGSSELTTTVRLRGDNWFVLRGPDGKETESLRVAFSDWTDRNNLAWLKRSADGYRFYGLRADVEGRMVSDPDNCSSCWSSNELKYVGADGRDKIATIEMYAAPQGQPSFSTEVLEVGAPVTFDAGGFKPANAVGPVTYQWQFQRDDCGVLRCTELTGPNFDVVPIYGPPVTGATASHTWQSR